MSRIDTLEQKLLLENKKSTNKIINKVDNQTQKEEDQGVEVKSIDINTMEKMFGIKARSQIFYRERIVDPLPFYQLGGVGSKIFYRVSEVERWMVRQNSGI